MRNKKNAQDSFPYARVVGLLGASQASVRRWLQGYVASEKYLHKIQGIIYYLKCLKGRSANKKVKCEVLRKRVNISVKELASYFSVSEKTIYNWEERKDHPSSKIMKIKQEIYLFEFLVDSMYTAKSMD